VRISLKSLISRVIRDRLKSSYLSKGSYTTLLEEDQNSLAWNKTRSVPFPHELIPTPRVPLSNSTLSLLTGSIAESVLGPHSPTSDIPRLLIRIPYVSSPSVTPIPWSSRGKKGLSIKNRKNDMSHERHRMFISEHTLGSGLSLESGFGIRPNSIIFGSA
jgi:hypothetical protein